MQTGLLCLLLGDIVENPVVYAISLRRFIQPKPANSLHGGVRYEDRRFIPSYECWHPPQPTLDSYACGLPLTHLTFELQLPWPWACVPITVSYRTETEHTLKEDLILTRRASNSKMGQRVCQKRVMKTWNETRDLAEHEAITWTILWSTEQNAVQIISLMLWTVSICDRMRNKG